LRTDPKPEINAVIHSGAAKLAPQYPIEGVLYRSAEYAQRQLELGNWLDLTIGESLRATERAVPTNLQ